MATLNPTRINHLSLLTLLTLLNLCSFQTANAQDIITLKDDTKIKCTIVEISEEQIKYKPWGAKHDRIVVIDRTLIGKVKYEDGEPDVLTKSNIEKIYYLDDRKNNLKFSFLAPLYNGYTFTYERALSPVTAYEVSLRIQGGGLRSLGNDDPNRYTTGVGVSGGLKLSLSSATRKATKNNHLLHGSYLRPEIMIARSRIAYSYTLSNTWQTTYNSYKASTLGMFVSIGKQWIFNNRMSLDIYYGVGYTMYLKDGYKDVVANGDNVVSPRRTYQVGGEVTALNTIMAAFGIRFGYVFDVGKKATKK